MLQQAQLLITLSQSSNALHSSGAHAYFLVLGCELLAQEGEELSTR
jgi:hypothetical protein